MPVVARLVPVVIFVFGVLCGRLTLPSCSPATAPQHGGATAKQLPSSVPTAAERGSSAPLSGLAPAHRSLLRRVYPLYDEAEPWDTVPFAQYDVVLVTGPQRSGTTWAACALATQLNYTLFDERHPITGGNDTLRALQRTFAYLRARGERAVVQSPMGTKDLHLLPVWPGLLVAFMARNCIDVFRSPNKVDKRQGGWTCSAGRTRELLKYRNRPDLRPHFDDRDMVCKIKQDVWRSFQSPLLRARAASAAGFGKRNISVTVDFDSFRSHPLWLRGEQRRGLGIKSTNCDLVASTPERTAWSTQRWMAEGDAALQAASTAKDRENMDFSQQYQPQYGQKGRCTNCVWS